jgi:HTH-type transcriptional regulator/antitoxin HigA
MKYENEILKDAWIKLAPVLTPPSNDEELRKTRSFADSILEDTGGDVSHPLYGLFLFLCDIIEAYERERFPEPAADPVDCLRYLMEEHGLKQKDLVDIGLGATSTVSNILAGRRALSKKQINVLANHFGCSPAVFFPSSPSAKETNA